MIAIKLSATALAVLCLGAFGNPLREAHQGLAGAQKQFESRWAQVQERFKGDAAFLLFLKKQQESWEHFLSYFPVEPNMAGSADQHAAHIRDRSKWLNGMLVDPATTENPEGLYWTAKGNSLRIQKIGTKIYFGLHTYEYSHNHMGIISGTIDRWKDGKGLFKANLSENENDPRHVTIKFELRNGLMIVEPGSGSSIGLSSIGGPRAYIDGVYSRISSLKERDHRILKSDIKYYTPPGFSSPLK